MKGRVVSFSIKMPTDRQQVNINSEQIQRALEVCTIEAEAEMSTSALIRLLINEALYYRENNVMAESAVTGLFNRWGLERVRNLTISCIDWLSKNNQNHQQQKVNSFFIRAIQNQPVDIVDVSAVAAELGIDSDDLLFFITNHEPSDRLNTHTL